MADYNIKINNLDKRLDGTEAMIRDAARYYYDLLRGNISSFSRSGALLNSWKFEILNDKEASVYSNLPYARVQDLGNKTKITNKMRSFAWYMWHRTENPMWKAIAITKKGFITIPAKNYSQVNLSIIQNLLEGKYPIKNI